ncbi:hypothetical protein N7491_011061 [Penicillium cf. griseofulvum]|uniref:Uncharacterized protein n=1 Tax=Penicillium cf. griseofulvum TaxID=2972120 RepID=A0A9W9N117_9EURO|nr:hypothetical protein N7472_001380 [Penicillium cf. griseofulvum]KAJ5422616.1 hypothetical protein N7491_011061 [Penicillium cf. griseofulvum]KAJ5428793.1 hypothetical protein N7445_010247 [Penicillium cf. griseofulvum]
MSGHFHSVCFLYSLKFTTVLTLKQRLKSKGQLELLTQHRVRGNQRNEAHHEILWEGATVLVAICAAMINLHFANDSGFHANIPSMIQRQERRMEGLVEELIALRGQEIVDY